MVQNVKKIYGKSITGANLTSLQSYIDDISTQKGSAEYEECLVKIEKWKSE